MTFHAEPQRTPHAATLLRLLPLAALFGALGCAALSEQFTIRPATWKSVKAPPYCRELVDGYAGPPDASRIGLLPVRVSPELSAILVPGPVHVALADLVAATQRLVDSSGWTERVEFAAPPRETPPRVYLGLMGDYYSPTPGIPMGALQLFGRGCGPLWRAQLAGAARQRGLEYLVELSLGVTRFRSSLGGIGIAKKQALLGPGHSVPIEHLGGWLEEDTVDVLVLYGALMDSSGAMLRVAAEGVVCTAPLHDLEHDVWYEPGLRQLLERGTPLNARREDLPGAPPVYVVATRNVLADLLRRPGIAGR